MSGYNLRKNPDEEVVARDSGNPSYFCFDCESFFSTAAALSRCKTKHKVERGEIQAKHKCECGLGFVRKDQFLKHVKICTRASREKQITSNDNFVTKNDFYNAIGEIKKMISLKRPFGADNAEVSAKKNGRGDNYKQPFEK